MSEVALSRRQAFLILNALPNIGPISLNRLLDAFDGDPVRVLQARAGELQRVPNIGPAIAGSVTGWEKHFKLEHEEKLLKRTGARFVIVEDEDYPLLLRRIHDPPIGLYWMGDYKIDRPCIAVVGSRRCTLYGLGVARKLGSDLARLGFCTVSGMARGIDRAAHEGALEAKGPTLAVFGNGLDIVYPPENIDLYREIQGQGAILSEFAFGKRSSRTTFPMRNRVVSGICHAVVVVETDVAGGSMITAKFAGEQGRQVFAVPGRIDMASSAGCLKLIRDGATMFVSIDDLLEELGYHERMRQMGLFPEERTDEEAAASAGPSLGDEEQKVLDCFRGGEMPDSDSVSRQTGLPVHTVAATLMMLELKRLIAKRADGRFEKR